MTRRAGLWALICLFASCDASIARAELAATLKVTADPVQPAHVPILLTLTIRNAGTEPISYWRGSAGGYPDASSFTAAISYAGRTRTVLADRLSNSNGQFASGAGRMRALKPGESASFPAALRPLPPGTYSIYVAGEPQGRVENGRFGDIWFPATWSQPLRVEIRYDEKLAAGRDADLIARVRKGDPFAQHVAARFPRPQVQKALEQDLSGDDIVAAEGAMDALWPDYNPSTDAAPLIAKAIRSHLKPINDGHDEWLLQVLLRMSGRFRAPEVQAAVKELAAARPEGRVHRYAQSTLLNFPTPTATKTPDRSDDLVEELLINTLVKSKDPKTRAHAYESLAAYPNSQRAIDTVMAGISDDDPSVRTAAEKAWKTMKAARPNPTQQP